MSGSVLRDAIASGFEWDVRRILIGAQDVSKMRSPIYTGIQSSDWVMRKSAADIIASVDNLGNAAIHICVIHGRDALLKLLLEADDGNLIDIHQKGLGGYTAACMAASRNQVTCLQNLLEAGVDVNEQDVTQWSLLHHAASNRCMDVLDLLLQKEECARDPVNNTGHTPLMLVCMNNDIESIKVMILAGAEPDGVCLVDTNQNCYDLVSTEEAREAIEWALVERAERRKKLEEEEAEKRERLKFMEDLKKKKEDEAYGVV